MGNLTRSAARTQRVQQQTTIRVGGFQMAPASLTQRCEHWDPEVEVLQSPQDTVLGDSSAERNYDVGNRELLAVKLALEEWRHWLEGAKQPFIILTDHKNLEYIKTAKRLNPHQARPGTKNTKPDVLSRVYESDPTSGNQGEFILPDAIHLAITQVEREVREAHQNFPPPMDCPDVCLQDFTLRRMARLKGPIRSWRPAYRLHILCEDNPTKWAENLSLVEHSINALPSSATGLAPFYIIFGHQPAVFTTHERAAQAYADILHDAMKGMQVGLLIACDGGEQGAIPHEVFDVALVEETIVLHNIKDVTLGFAMLMGVIYCVNLKYPDDMKYSFEFLQRVVMKIRPDQASARVHVFRNRILRCTVIPSIPSGGTTSFNCTGMTGRVVNLFSSAYNVLTICEVEVYGEPAAPLASFSAEVMGRKIAVVEEKLCWSDALLYCREYYWDLLSIRSAREQSGVEEVLKNLTEFFPTPTRHVWLGLRRYLRGSTWFWMSGPPMYYVKWEHQHIWQVSSPCGGIETSEPFYWRDLPCWDNFYFICLKDFETGGVKAGFSSYVV
nr:PREDICTED: uncharacterized protein LOC106527345 [Austrofundulus limnaeus]